MVDGKDPAAGGGTTHQEKVEPPSPPKVIKDKERGWVYTRVGFLGSGGFARVYEVQDQKGSRRAVKVVNKATIKSKKNKTKLWAEIKLHQMLDHPNVVRFEDCFEDAENVYMVLELCEHGSLMDLLRRRRRYTEPEARHILVQLIGACQYMHKTNVIHRDLKLGNLFLDANMDVKVGDFGLAALIEKPGDRKKTICGTPNYIAPEVLFDTANGHSFEVDVWSVGVILYTLLIGKPPFQTKDVKAIYKRIRENRYEFPADKEISTSAKDLISSILNPNPDKRPTLETVLSHNFFLDGPFPSHIPPTANDLSPDFRHITMTQSRKNFQTVSQKAKIGMSSTINLDSAKMRVPLGPSILQQERDFKLAVQPDSPISALLKSARQPLVQASDQIKEPSLLRKLQAAGAHATLSPARRCPAAAGPSRRQMDRVGEEEEEEELRPEEETPYEAGIREKTLVDQKARIVSQMTPRKKEYRDPPRQSADGGLVPAKTVQSASTETRRPAETGKEDAKMTSLFEIVGKTLDRAMDSPETLQIPPRKAEPPKVFVVSWLDYCSKYGMGFAMTDGTVSVHFNDSSSLVLAPGKQYFDHIQPSSNGDTVQGTRRNYLMAEYPRELNNRVYLLKNFENYMTDRLRGEHPYTFDDTELTKGMVFVTRYLRLKHVILFRLSNDILQFNFYDHTKLILSQDGHVVSVIDKHYVLRTWSLAELLHVVNEETVPKEKKRLEGVIHKVSYARDVLAKIKTHAMTRAKSSSALALSSSAGGSAPPAPPPSSERVGGERDMRPIR